MAREKEIKVILKIPLANFLDKIQNKGYGFKNSINQTDIYFDTRSWFLYKSIAALRLRQVDKKDHSFSFKKIFYFPNKQGKFYIEEVETKAPFNKHGQLKEVLERVNIPIGKSQINSGKDIVSFLTLKKFYDEQKMFKKRDIYSDGSNDFVVDDIEKVGIIIELECKKLEPLNVIQSVLKNNEWQRSVEGSSYIWLKRVKGFTSHLDNINKFKTKPDWNVWSNERDWYEKMSNN